MKQFKKMVLGLGVSLSAGLPAFANYTQFDVQGTLDNSISIEVYDSTNAIFSGNDNSTNIPVIQFGKVNTSGRQIPTDIGAGVGGVQVNTFYAFTDNGTTGNLMPSGITPPPSEVLKGGYFGIHSPGGSIRVRVDSMASASTNVAVDYTTITGTPPDLVLSNASTPLSAGQFPPPSGGVSVIQAGDTGRKIAGAGGEVTATPISNGQIGQLGLNIGLLPLNASGGGTLSDGAFTGRVKFTASP